MIVLATAETLASFGGKTEAAVRVGGLFRAYGADTNFLQFYHDTHGAVASVMDGTAVLSVPTNGLCDAEEWAWFLAAQPTVQCVRTNADIPECAAAFPHQRNGVVLSASAGMEPIGQTVSLSPRAVYAVIQEAFLQEAPAFEGFYLDVSHRMRHGCCRTVGVMADGIPAATALTVAETNEAAVIGGVATREEYRCRGYARACVTTLAVALQQEGKTVLIAPRDARAEALYRNWGFVSAGTWTEVNR